MGIKHCGKTTLGKLLAKERKIPFYDLDHTILEIYNGGVGITIRDIFTDAGKDKFRELEAEGIKKIVTDYSVHTTPAVCALGGGTIENRTAMTCFPKTSLFCYIHEPPEVLFKRIMERGLPAFLDAADPWKSFKVLYDSRTALYKEKAHIKVYGKGRDINSIFKTLHDALCREIGRVG